MEIRNLKPIHETFSKWYAETGNASLSARMAGYSVKNAGKQGAELLKNKTATQQLITKRIESIREKLNNNKPSELVSTGEGLKYLSDAPKVQDSADRSIDQPLNSKQILFCKEFIKTGNATEAAKAAGYTSNSDQSLSNQGYRLLKKESIIKYINELKLFQIEEKLSKNPRFKNAQVITSDKDRMKDELDSYINNKTNKKEKVKKEKVSESFLYLIGNKAWDGVKIGRTSNIEKRIGQYNLCQFEECYILDWHPVVTSSNEDENTLIESFDKYIKYSQEHKKGNEWFKIDDIIATRIFRQTLEGIRQKYIRKLKDRKEN